MPALATPRTKYKAKALLFERQHAETMAELVETRDRLTRAESAIRDLRDERAEMNLRAQQGQETVAELVQAVTFWRLVSIGCIIFASLCLIFAATRI